MATNKKRPYKSIGGRSQSDIERDELRNVLNSVEAALDANTDISDGVPIKSEHDFLVTALKKGAAEINWASRQFTNALGMVHPTRGAAVYFGQAMEITFLLNHATKRCIELIENVEEDNPNSESRDMSGEDDFEELKRSIDRDGLADIPVYVSPVRASDVDTFSEENRRKNAGGPSPRPTRAEVAALKRGPIPRNARRKK